MRKSLHMIAMLRGASHYRDATYSKDMAVGGVPTAELYVYDHGVALIGRVINDLEIQIFDAPVSVPYMHNHPDLRELEP